MYLQSLFFALALVLGAFASQWTTIFTKGSSTGPSQCMTKAEAETVARNFRKTIAEPFDINFVKATFTRNFHDYSDSVSELINSGCSNGPAPLGLATFTSRQQFIDGQGSQKPIPFEILNIWHGCESVSIRWYSPAPGHVEPQQQVTGIIVAEVEENLNVHSDEPWLVKTVYSEFNSGAWLYDIGNFTPSCDTHTQTTPTHPITAFSDDL